DCASAARTTSHSRKSEPVILQWEESGVGPLHTRRFLRAARVAGYTPARDGFRERCHWATVSKDTGLREQGGQLRLGQRLGSEPAGDGVAELGTGTETEVALPEAGAGVETARADAFISYSHRDSEFVEGVLLRVMHERGKNVWLDRSDIPGGSAWP